MISSCLTLLEVAMARCDDWAKDEMRDKAVEKKIETTGSALNLLSLTTQNGRATEVESFWKSKVKYGVMVYYKGFLFQNQIRFRIWGGSAILLL